MSELTKGEIYECHKIPLSGLPPPIIDLLVLKRVEKHHWTCNLGNGDSTGSFLFDLGVYPSVEV